MHDDIVYIRTHMYVCMYVGTYVCIYNIGRLKVQPILCLVEFDNSEHYPVLLMRSGILRKGLSAHWQRNEYYQFGSKSSTNVGTYILHTTYEGRYCTYYVHIVCIVQYYTEGICTYLTHRTRSTVWMWI